MKKVVDPRVTGHPLRRSDIRPKTAAQLELNKAQARLNEAIERLKKSGTRR